MSYQLGYTELEELRQLAKQFGVQGVAAEVLNDPRFVIWSGSSKPHQHHYGKHGLVLHTLEVTQLCLQTNDYFSYNPSKQADPVKLFLAALFHDAGKMWDYEPTNEAKTEWTGGQHKRRVHHISRSALTWEKARVGFDDPNDDVLHAILSHHGCREWGSPVAPNTRLAWMLHLCDGISARIDDCDKFDRVQ